MGGVEMADMGGMPGREHDIDWHRAVADVVWLPERHRRPDMDPTAARRALRCTAASFAQLVELGLPSADGPDGPLYDRHDVQNVALFSGTGLTDVELGMRLVLAFMQASREELTAPRRWRYELALRSQVEPGAALLRRLYRPTPEVSGGTLESCRLASGAAASITGPYVDVPQGAAVSGTMVTCGIDQTVRSEQARAVALDVLDSGVKWQYLPPSLAAVPFEAFELGVGNCGTLCAVLVHRLVEAGFEAQSYQGWMIALNEMGHGWVELVDEDGKVKWLDPSFALLATANRFGTPSFREFVLGAVLNRVVPTRAPLDGPLHADDGDEDEVGFTCRPERAEASPRRWRRPRVAQP